MSRRAIERLAHAKEFSERAKARGTEIHKAIEHRIRTGEILDNEWSKCVEAVESFLPDYRQIHWNEPNRDHYHETEYEFSLRDACGKWLWGRIDLIYPLRRQVYDWKTTSYRKIEHDRVLEQNFTQIVAYAKALTDHVLFEPDDDRFKHHARIDLVYIRVGKRPDVEVCTFSFSSDLLKNLWSEFKAPNGVITS